MSRLVTGVFALMTAATLGAQPAMTKRLDLTIPGDPRAEESTSKPLPLRLTLVKLDQVA